MGNSRSKEAELFKRHMRIEYACRSLEHAIEDKWTRQSVIGHGRYSDDDLYDVCEQLTRSFPEYNIMLQVYRIDAFFSGLDYVAFHISVKPGNGNCVWYIYESESSSE